MEKLKQFGGQTPLGRPGQPVELASIYVQLVPVMPAMQQARFTVLLAELGIHNTFKKAIEIVKKADAFFFVFESKLQTVEVDFREVE